MSKIPFSLNRKYQKNSQCEGGKYDMWGIFKKIFHKNEKNENCENAIEEPTNIEQNEETNIQNESWIEVDINKLISKIQENNNLDSFEKKSVLNILYQIKEEIILNDNTNNN